jgi:hypothetical protein
MTTWRNRASVGSQTDYEFCQVRQVGSKLSCMRFKAVMYEKGNVAETRRAEALPEENRKQDRKEPS